jgi:hypothetical protein
MRDRHQQLVRLIRDETGESFRAAFAYDADDWTALYVRSDLATADLESVVPSLADRARSRGPLVREAEYDQLGTHRASISLHDDAVLVQFHGGGQSGVVVTLDTDVARNLAEFVARCESVLAE